MVSTRECSKCGYKAEADERKYLDGNVLCIKCVEDMLSEFHTIFGVYLCDSQCGYTIELEDVCQIISSMSRDEDLGVYTLSDEKRLENT